MPGTSSSGPLPENILRQIWKHQRFNANNLRTADGRGIEILFPGFLNTDGGPDFTRARIRIGGVLHCGEVELHRTMKDWSLHAHHLDSKYNRVILHVIGSLGPVSVLPSATKSKRDLPVLVLAEFLAPPYQQAAGGLSLPETSEIPRALPCFGRNGSIEGTLIRKWLERLAVERLEVKVRRFEERLKELVEEHERGVGEPLQSYPKIRFGLNPEELPPPVARFTPQEYGKLVLWEQLLYEGIMEALGYSKNQEAMLKLAQALRLRFVIGQRLNTPAEKADRRVEAALFGAAGLLPRRGQCADRASASRASALRREWKSIRASYHGELLHEAEWQFFRLRPENFPTLRIAAAARLVGRFAEGGYLRSIIRTVKEAGLDVPARYRRLRSLLMIETTPFWSAHYRFGRPAGRRLRMLVGRARAESVILNAIIPIVMLYARLFNDVLLRATMASMMDFAPAEPWNAFTRIIDSQLVRNRFSIRSAKLQQGSLQLYRSYCARSRCSECVIGTRIRERS